MLLRSHLRRASLGLRRAAFLLSLLSTSCASPPAPARPDSESERPLVIPPLSTTSARPPRTEPPGDALPIGIAAARDPRIARRRPRSRAQVLAEAQEQERRLGANPAATDPAALHHRLAEAYDELAGSASGAEASHARKDAIRHYTEINDRYPQYSRIDEVLYYLGLDHEQTGDVTSARRAYYELVQRAPRSKLVPYVYFALGELFTNEAGSDPTKNDLASLAYEEVLKSPPSDNPLFPEALLRLGETALRAKDSAKATAMFDRLRREFPDSNAAGTIPAR